MRQDSHQFHIQSDIRLCPLSYSVQSCFHIMDVCHSRTSAYDAVNRNKAPPPLMKPVTLPSGPNIAVFNKIPSLHSQVCFRIHREQRLEIETGLYIQQHYANPRLHTLKSRVRATRAEIW